ncbi:MAG: ATP-binding cassette domain-containing protein [Planctomycetota bacterium]
MATGKLSRSTTTTIPRTPVLRLGEVVLSRFDVSFLRVADLELGPGECGLIRGISGSGKTSLLDAITGVVAPRDPLVVRGLIEIEGRPRPAAESTALRSLLSTAVTRLPQDPIGAFDPVARLGQQLLPRVPAGIDALCEALAALDIEDPRGFLARMPNTISGGQAQRAWLAVALARKTRLCLFDEPSAGLDDSRVDQLLAALERLRDSTAGTAMLIASHDPRFARLRDVRCFAIEDGALATVAPPVVAPIDSRPAAASNGRVLLTASNLAIARGGRTLLRDVSIELREGEIVALLGSSGVGKSSLAAVLTRHASPAAGRVTTTLARREVQLLFQDAAASLTPKLPIAELCREVRREGTPVDGYARALGLTPELLARTARELSGGEQRRAALLRALAANPRVLVADEPTANLDADAAQAVRSLLLTLKRERGMAVLWITHDDATASAVADRILRLETTS